MTQPERKSINRDHLKEGGTNDITDIFKDFVCDAKYNDGTEKGHI